MENQNDKKKDNEVQTTEHSVPCVCLENRRKSAHFEEKFEESMKSLEENCSYHSFSEFEEASDVEFPPEQNKSISLNDSQDPKRKISDTFGEHYRDNYYGTRNKKLYVEEISDNSDVEAEPEEEVEEVEAVNYETILTPEIDPSYDDLFYQQLPLPFTERRRLSECLEEDEEESEPKVECKMATILSETSFHSCDSGGSKTTVELEKIDENVAETKENIIEESDGLVLEEKTDKEKEEIVSSEPAKPENLNENVNVVGRKHKFVVTKTPAHIEQLRNYDQKTNWKTIHFPTSSSTVRPSLQSIFGGSGRAISPHLDKKFFDVSLVEIRSQTDSITTLDQDAPKELDEVWVKRPQPGDPPSLSENESGRPRAGTWGSNTKPGAASADSKNKKIDKQTKKNLDKEARKSEKEARRQEKLVQKNEKEARKAITKKENERLKNERWKAERVSKSTERLGSGSLSSNDRVSRSGSSTRSGSLERRQSGGHEDREVMYQLTVHGTASPNRRPAIFDAFRPRSKSDAKKQQQLVPPAQIPPKPKESSSSSSGSGGLMHNLRSAMQHTGLMSQKSSGHAKVKDGSAHPHPGSDAQYYHTVTAASSRRPDSSRSPMTKVMDLFRHRSNSAVSDADKRKARAVALQQQLANQSAHMRRASQELERRRASLGGLASPRGTRTEPLDPHHAAILFRDSRGVSDEYISF